MFSLLLTYRTGRTMDNERSDLGVKMQEYEETETGEDSNG